VERLALVALLTRRVSVTSATTMADADMTIAAVIRAWSAVTV
jgi:hypothetical protein